MFKYVREILKSNFPDLSQLHPRHNSENHDTPEQKQAEHGSVQQQVELTKPGQDLGDLKQWMVSTHFLHFLRNVNSDTSSDVLHQNALLEFCLEFKKHVQVCSTPLMTGRQACH